MRRERDDAADEQGGRSDSRERRRRRRRDGDRSDSHERRRRRHREEDHNAPNRAEAATVNRPGMPGCDAVLVFLPGVKEISNLQEALLRSHKFRGNQLTSQPI